MRTRIGLAGGLVGFSADLKQDFGVSAELSAGLQELFCLGHLSETLELSGEIGMAEFSATDRGIEWRISAGLAQVEVCSAKEFDAAPPSSGLSLNGDDAPSFVLLFENRLI